MKLKLFNKLFKQQPKQPEYKWEPWEVKAARYDAMDQRHRKESVAELIR